MHAWSPNSKSRFRARDPYTHSHSAHHVRHAALQPLQRSPNVSVCNRPGMMCQLPDPLGSTTSKVCHGGTLPAAACSNDGSFGIAPKKGAHRAPAGPAPGSAHAGTSGKLQLEGSTPDEHAQALVVETHLPEHCFQIQVHSLTDTVGRGYEVGAQASLSDRGIRRLAFIHLRAINTDASHKNAAGDRKRGQLSNARGGRRRPEGAFEGKAAHNTDIT